MGFQVSFGQADAQVRTGKLRRDVARGAAGLQAWIVIAPVAPPRLWRMVSDAAAQSFERALHGQLPTVETVNRAAHGIAAAIARIRDQLVEPHLRIDAEVGVVVAAERALHVGLTSGIRFYRARKGVPERLHANAVAASGVSDGTLYTASEQTSPGDLFILGGKDTFAVRSMGALAALLARTARPPVVEISEAVLAPCRAGGVGAAALVLAAD